MSQLSAESQEPAKGRTLHRVPDELEAAPLEDAVEPMLVLSRVVDGPPMAIATRLLAGTDRRCSPWMRLRRAITGWVRAAWVGAGLNRLERAGHGGHRTALLLAVTVDRSPAHPGPAGGL